MAYTGASEFYTFLGADSGETAVIPTADFNRLIDAATGIIDRVCKRSFGLVRLEPRTFYPDGGQTRINTGDIARVPPAAVLGHAPVGAAVDITKVEINGETIGTTEYRLIRVDPLRASTFLALTSGCPWRRTSWRFDVPVTVTANWGWPEVPSAIEVAALLLMNRLYQRPKSPFGTLMIGDEAMQMMTYDADANALMRSYKLEVGADPYTTVAPPYVPPGSE